ncbi:MAG: F0F1 ATP synthase subunit delta [Candidatus Berkelbacteria bacterium]|nr:F0F1 ATP synthase subunit delta [Candidatus Berkelbacteria bacterium]
MKKSISKLAEITASKINFQNVGDFAKALWFELQKQKKLGQMDNLLVQIKEKMSASNNKLSAYVYSMEVLNEQDLKLIQKRLEEKYESKVDLTSQTDKNILGGIKIRVQDEMIDLSWRGQLNQLRLKMAGGR